MCRVYLFPRAGGYLRQYDLRSDSSPSGSAPASPVAVRADYSPAGDSLPAGAPYSESGGLSPERPASLPEATSPPSSAGRAHTIPGFVPLGTTMIGEKPDDIAAQTFGKAQTLKWLNAENDNG